jgi:transposase
MGWTPPPPPSTTGSEPGTSAGKKTAHASEQERADVQAARAVWRKRQAWLLAHPGRIGNIVFIDETGINTKMARLRGRCPRGQRMVAPIPHGHWKTLTFIAALRHDGLTAPWVVDGAMTADIFETYIETQLVPTLNKGDVVVLDNLSAHKRNTIRKLVETRGAWLLFLPPYSPDLNPIELAFSKFKAHMKRLKPRTVDELWKAAGIVCDLFKPDECLNYFIADGYASE